LKKLAVVIPTYNRPQLLREALAATLAQSYPPTEIVVVDNASLVPVTQSLGDWLLDKQTVTVLRVEPNVYPAGAFHEGLKYAFQKGFDAYMFFDDDAEPAPDCIRNLMEHFSDDIGLVAPLVYDSIAREYQFFQNKFMPKGLVFDIPVFKTLQDVGDKPIKIDANATTGIIVSHQAVEKVGNINRQFRTYGEDTEFTLRINRHFDCYLVPNALLIHKVQPSDINTQPLKNYYWVRNRFFMIRTFASGRDVAHYAVLTAFEAFKQIVRLRHLKTSSYRLAAFAEGLFGTIPTEPIRESLWGRTPRVVVNVFSPEREINAPPPSSN